MVKFPATRGKTQRLIRMMAVATAIVWAGAVTLPGGTSDIVIPRVPNPPANLKDLPGDLAAIAVATPPNLREFIRDEEAALVLGKALFWDMQVGSDGVQACATCHFRAGADPRSRNQVSPGLLRHAGMDLTFKRVGPNGQLQPADFPLTRLQIPGVRGALDPSDSNDVVSSQGVHHQKKEADPMGFTVGNLNTRRVEPRNTPTVINAVFNHRQFWDGRAENVFNGVNHVGARDTSARVARADDRRATPEFVAIAITNASLASQAVAPIISDFEMAAPGRTTQEVARALARWPREIGRRLEKVRPLAK